MNTITFYEPVTMSFSKSAGTSRITFEAHRDYVLSKPQTDNLMKDSSVRERVYKLSCIDNTIPNFNVNDATLKGKNILLYNGSGGYGDQIMMWPFAQYLSKLGYKIHVASDPGNHTCWWNFAWLKGIHTIPLQSELFWMFDGYVLFDFLVNMNEHTDQDHPLDVMFRKVGIDPDKVTFKDKSVAPNFTASENIIHEDWAGKKLAIYQISCATPIRSMTPSNSAYLLKKLAMAYPDWEWLAIYDSYTPDTYTDAIKCRKCKGEKTVMDMKAKMLVDTKFEEQKASLKESSKAATETPEAGETAEEMKSPDYSGVPTLECDACKGFEFPTLANNVRLFTTTNLRQLWSLTQKAEVVVSPDSMMIHVAGSLGIPCVGLWGLTDPARRAGYYTNHFPIFHPESCPHSPCFSYTVGFPKYCPTRPGGRQECEVLSTISPGEVVDKIKDIVLLKEAKIKEMAETQKNEQPSHA